MINRVFLRILQVLLWLQIVRQTISFQSHRYSFRAQAKSLYMAGGQIPLVPYYPTKGSKDYQWMDIYNALGRERTLFVSRYLDEESCNQLIASLIWLQSQSSIDPITIYFNAPGSILKPAFAVYDVMRRMSCPIITINAGLSVGMAALLCSVGSSGKRYAFPNSRFLMSRGGLEDGVQGQAVDIHLQVEDVMRDNNKFISELAKLCGQPKIKVENDFKRDFYLTAAEACAYGLIDKVLLPPQPIKIMRYRGVDDEVIGYGHFCEVRKVLTGPNDKLEPPSATEDIDEYAANELQKKGITPGQKKKNKFANRFANSRCKPPGAGTYKPPTVPGDKEPDEFDRNPFKNTGW